MKRYCNIFWLVVILFVLCLGGSSAIAGNIDPDNDGSSFTYGENIGWLNLSPAYGGGVTVADSVVTGYTWSENTGWINLSCLNSGMCSVLSYGVLNDGTGALSGYAWGKNIGWINFAPPGGGVQVDSCGNFTGTAWGENIGWINFDIPASLSSGVKTAWDGVAPATSATVSGDNTQKGITLLTGDCSSGVKEVHYILDSDPEVIISTSGPSPMVTSVSTSFNVTSEGNHTLSYFSVDNMGNTEAQRTLTFYIDTTAPVITVTSPSPGGVYYVGSEVYANYTVDDPVSGVLDYGGTVPDGALLDTSTAGTHTITLFATDSAGNSISTTITYEVIPFGNTDPNNDGSSYAYGENIGWINFKPSAGNNVNVTDSNVLGYAWGENIGWITMNPANGGVINDGYGVLIGHAWGENAGWITFAPAGGGVSIDACGHFTGKAWGENIGWINFDVPSKVKTAWEKVAPVTTFTAPAPVWDNGWNNRDVRLEFFSSDCGSGVRDVHYILDSDPEMIVSGSSVALDITTEGIHTISYFSIDNNGNQAAAKTITIKIDKTPPVITVSSPVNGAIYFMNSPVYADFFVTDALSGIPAFGGINATVPSGSLIDTSIAGTYTFEVSAIDQAGNTALATITYTVIAFGNVDPNNEGSSLAYGENIGWINLKPAIEKGVGVNDALVIGYAWSENIGWISLSCLNTNSCGSVDYGVVNDGAGNLYGYGWGENVGWVNFAPNGGGVTVNPVTGVFSGKVWGENIGWISFDSAGIAPFKVSASWCADRPLAAMDWDNDCIVNDMDNCPSVFNPDQTDTEGDGIGNICDPDDDNDGLPDTWEVRFGMDPSDATGNNGAGGDADWDGVLNISDNAPKDYNPDQRDTDGDGVADVADAYPADPLLSEPDPSVPVTDASSNVGAGGGTVSAADGSIEVHVPLDAVAGDTTITVTRNLSGQGGLVVQTDQGAGDVLSAYNLYPDGIAFNQPVTLVFSYNDQGIDEASLRVYWYNPQTVSYEMITPYTVDTVANTITVQVTHFSTYALIQLLDTTPPAIDAVITPEPNPSGWHNTDVTVTFTCTDSESGVAVCPAPVTLSSEGGSQVISGTAYDRAGNSATATVTVSLDRTPPVIACPPDTEIIAMELTGSPVTDAGIQSFLGRAMAIDNLSDTVRLGNDALAFFNIGQTYVAFMATDSAGNQGSCQAAVTVINPPPVLNPIGNQLVDEAQALSLVITAVDPNDPAGLGLTYSATGLPPGATFDPQTGVFSYTPAYDVSTRLSDSFFDVFFEVSDGTYTANETVRITVRNVNRPPAASAGVDLQLECAGASCPVILDGRGSYDPDSSAGTQDDIAQYRWYAGYGTDGQQILGTGAEAVVMLSIGVHEITLEVTDQSGAIGWDTVTVTLDPAHLSMLVLEKAEIDWPKTTGAMAEVKLHGRLALPVGLLPQELAPVAGITLDIAGESSVYTDTMNLTLKGEENEKWEFKANPSGAGTQNFSIHWKGAKFDYKNVIHLKTEFISLTETALSIERENVTEPVSLTVNGVSMSIDETGRVTSSVPYEVDEDGEVTFTLPFELTPSMNITLIRGSQQPVVIVVGDYYTPGSGNFEWKSKVNPNSLTGASRPAVLGMNLTLGNEGFPSLVVVSESQWDKLSTKEWKANLKK